MSLLSFLKLCEYMSTRRQCVDGWLSLDVSPCVRSVSITHRVETIPIDEFPSSRVQAEVGILKHIEHYWQWMLLKLLLTIFQVYHIAIMTYAMVRTQKYMQNVKFSDFFSPKPPHYGLKKVVFITCYNKIWTEFYW